MVSDCQAILTADKSHADAWFLLSIAAEAQRDIARALKLVTQAATLAPGNPEYLAQQAKLLALSRQVNAAREAARAALRAGPARALTLDTLGVTLTRLGEHAEAAAALRRAVEKAPDNAQFHFNLASAEQFLGNTDAAREHYERAIELQPDFARAYWALSELEKNTPDPRRLASLEALFHEKTRSAIDRLYLGHALARGREHGGDFAGAFAALETAKAGRRASLNYLPEQDRTLFGSIIDSFQHPLPRASASRDTGWRPLFVTGMPRSGTTLVEQMLAAHPAVDTLGELQDFPLAIKTASGDRSAQMLNAEVIRGALGAEPAAIATQYRESLEAHAGSIANGTRYLIDKMPLNFLYIGFILRALPEARVVIVRRHPLDTCLSNYRQLFAVEFSYYNYAYRLEDIAAYYVLFDRICRHWRELYADRVHVLNYEELVERPRQVIEAALGYLELPWSDTCLDFHRRGGAVTSASTVQVRQPLYRSAVGRWERYREHLSPAIEILRAGGVLAGAESLTE